MRVLIFICLMANQTFGQISGTVTAASGEPVPFANIVCQNAEDSSIVSGASSNLNGRFSFTTEKTGSFFLQIRCLGYQTHWSKPFDRSSPNQTIALPNFVLSEENNTLDGVTISAKKDWIQNTPTGKTINIQSSLLTKGSNALQVLERLPGVITDRRNNQFSLNGQGGVTVLFNGRKVHMSMEEVVNMLESTAADNIEKIELITSPTAQYDADGGAGLINIVFKKSENEGTRINMSATAGYGYREKGAIHVAASQGFKKVNLYAAYAFLHDVGQSGYRGEGTAGSSFVLGETYNTFYGISSRNQNNHNLNLSLDYPLNSLTSMGGELLFSFGQSHNLVNSGGTYDFKTGDYIKLDGFSDGLAVKQNAISSFYFKRKITSKSTLNLDYSFIKYHNNSPAVINTVYFDEQDNPVVPQNAIFTAGNRGESFSKIKVMVLKADFSTQLHSKLHADFGAKLSRAKNTNDSKVERKENQNWTIDPRSQSNIYSQEHLLAAYAQFKFLLNPSSNLHLGLRYEYWKRDINIYQEPFTIAQFFPSVLFTHKINEHADFSLNYTRRISRPAYADLVSNLFYTDPTFIFSGNPLLKPTLTDVIKADFKTTGLNVGLSFQYEINPILRYQITSNATKDIGISSPQNLDFQKSINLFANYPMQVFDWWKISLASTTSLRHYKVSYSLNPAEKAFVFQNFNVSQSLQLPKNFELELSGWYNLPFFEGTNSLKGFGVLNLGMAKKLKNNKGVFQLSLPDLLQSFSVHTHISGMTPIVFDINTVSNWRDETAFYRVVKLSYSRNFGKNAQKTSAERDYEERNRVGN